jgi:hypothetical protein
MIALAQEQTTPKTPQNPQQGDVQLWAVHYCGPWEKVMKTPEKYKEGMLFAGEGITVEVRSGRAYKGGMFFFVNQDTGTWSLINVFGDGMGCMVQSGTGFEPYTGQQPWEKKQ